MLVICEDTVVSPYVIEFLTQSEGLGEEDVVQIDSDKKEIFLQKNGTLLSKDCLILTNMISQRL